MTSWIRVLATCFALLIARAVAAQESPGATREAGRHFQRGVALYSEADYRAALVEFRRAYALAPSVPVLYDIGEAQFQLQDYAAALPTFERYLAESAPGDGHRPEVESNVEILRARVGHVTVTTIPAGADVTIDDLAVGRTPLDRPVLVSIGRRKIVVTAIGRPPVTRYVDVATDDNLPVTIALADAAGPAQAPAVKQAASSRPGPSPEPSTGGSTWRVIGWTTTGLLAAGAVTFGVLAEKASSDLTRARSTYPVSQESLAHQANLTTTYSILADSLAVGALLTGSITLLTSLIGPSDAGPRDCAGATRFDIGPGSARLEVSF